MILFSANDEDWPAHPLVMIFMRFMVPFMSLMTMETYAPKCVIENQTDRAYITRHFNLFKQVKSGMARWAQADMLTAGELAFYILEFRQMQSPYITEEQGLLAESLLKELRQTILVEVVMWLIVLYSLFF